MGDGGNQGPGGVVGIGGVAAQAGALAGALGAVNACGADGGVATCQHKIHWVKATLKWKDTNTPVAAAESRILQGAAVINSGPLANGQIESRNLPGGTYSVTFPDIDASEWSEG